MIKNYFKIAFRNFWRHKLFTVINVVGLSIGISAAIVIYLIVHYDFTFDQFHPDKERIYRVVSDFKFSGDTYHNGGVTGPLAEAVRKEVTGLQESAPVYDNDQISAVIPDGSIKGKLFKDEKNVVFADQRYFAIFNYKWLAGSPATALKNPLQVVITDQQAKLYFPKLSYGEIMGKQITYDDSIKTTVTGVIQAYRANTDFLFHDFISFSTISLNKGFQNDLGQWGSTSSASQLYVKLAAKTQPASIIRQLNKLLLKYNPPKAEDKGNSNSLGLQPLSDIHFNADYNVFGNAIANKNTLYALMLIALFLLLLGCINFINLTTAQASQRAKEIGIRKTMGSSRTQLVVQFLSETFLVTLMAIVISILMAPFILQIFADFIAPGIKFDLLKQPGVLLFLFLLAIVVSVLSGFYPAMILSGLKPVSVLKNQVTNNSSKSRNAWLRKSLTITQFVIAQVFIMATILVSKQIHYALNKDLGFKKDAIIYVNTSWKLKNPNGKTIFLQKLRSMPQVENISLGAEPPSSDNTNTTAGIYKDGKKEIKTDVQRKTADPEYINVYKIKLLAGRNLKAGDTTTALVINQKYADVLGFKNAGDALGKTIKLNGDNRQIVGVVANFHQSSLHDPFKPLAILSEKQSRYTYRTFHIALKPQSAAGTEWKTAIASIQQAWKEIYPEEEFDYHFFDESIAKFYETEQHTSKLLAWATGLSVFISCLGLLGLAMYTTGLRTKEIGVRKVLGATVGQIVRLLSAEMVLLVMLAFIIATSIAWLGLNQWMQSYADRTAISWWIFALSGAAMLVTALITLSFQTVKAAIANPTKSLRSE